jgi:VanZ family protein
MGFIFSCSSVPGKDIPPLFPHADIVYHGTVYLTLALFFARAFKNTRPGSRFGMVFFVTVVCCVVYGLTDEFHQLFVPNRSADFFDVFIDGVGGLIGSLLYR